MSKQIEALKLALEALESSRVFVTTREKIKHPEGTDWYDERISAIKEALAQPEQEPVAFICEFYADEGHPFVSFEPVTHGTNTPLYTTPPQRTWVGLTPTQVKLLWGGVQEEAVKSGDSLNWVFYTHINEALKEKNT